MRKSFQGEEGGTSRRIRKIRGKRKSTMDDIFYNLPNEWYNKGYEDGLIHSKKFDYEKGFEQGYKAGYNLGSYLSEIYKATNDVKLRELILSFPRENIENQIFLEKIESMAKRLGVRIHKSLENKDKFEF